MGYAGFIFTPFSLTFSFSLQSAIFLLWCFSGNIFQAILSFSPVRDKSSLNYFIIYMVIIISFFLSSTNSGPFFLSFVGHHPFFRCSIGKGAC